MKLTVETASAKHVFDLGDDTWITLRFSANDVFKHVAKPRAGNIEAIEASEAMHVYQTYPRHVGKPAALRKIVVAMRKRGYAYILERTRLYADSWYGVPSPEMQYCPHPATWFHQERYNDDSSTWKRHNKGSKPNPRNAALSAGAAAKSERLAQYAREEL